MNTDVMAKHHTMVSAVRNRCLRHRAGYERGSSQEIRNELSEACSTADLDSGRYFTKRENSSEQMEKVGARGVNNLHKINPFYSKVMIPTPS